MISILYVDDEPNLLEIAKLFLEKTGQFSVETCTSPLNAKEMLASIRYDAIVSDYQMPDMDGIEFLKYVRKQYGRIPFILFTGKGREEVVINALDNGADFYLQKGGDPKSQFAELQNKIEKAVKEQQAEKSLAESEEKYRAFFKTSKDVMFIATKKGEWVDFNDAALDLFGYTDREEFSRIDIANLLVDAQENEKFVQLVDEDGFSKDFPVKLCKKDGVVIDALVTAVPVRDGKGHITGYLGTIKDITKLKKINDALQESEERYRNVVEDQTEFICRFFPDGTHVFVNEAYCRYFNKSRDEIIGKKFIPDLPAEDQNVVKDHFASLTKEHPVATIAHRIVMSDGEIHWQRWSDRAIFDKNGMLVEYQSVGRDITETKRAEKELQLKNAELHAAYEQITATEEELRQNYEELGKSQQDLQAAYEQLTATEEELRQNYEELGKSEQALRKSEERYRNVVEDQTEFICRFTPYGKLTFVNDAYCRYFGLDKETCIGTRHTVVIPSEDLERMTQHLSGFSPQNPFGIIEHRIIMPSGDVRWQHWSDRGIFDENGRVVEYQSVGRDITERKQAEDELRESENLFRSVGDSLLDPVLILSSEGIVQFANRAAIRFIGLPDAAIIHGQSFMTYLDGDSWNRAIGDLHTIHELGGPLTAEYCINPLKGETRWVEASVIRIDYKGSHAALVTLRDITERIRVEEQLRGSERRLADIISFLPDATLVIDKNGAVLAWNRAMEEMTGVPAEQMIGKANYEYALPFYHERRPIMVDLVLHDDPAIVAKYPVIKKEGNSLFSEIFIPHLNKGRGAHLWFTASPLCDTAGNLMGAIESIRDITERKAAEDALFRVNKKLTILSSITRHDIKNQLIALSAYLELSKKELDPLLPASEYLKKEVKIAQTIEHQIDFTKVYEDMGTTAPVWQNIKASVRRATAALPKGNVRVEIDRTDLEIYADSLFEKVFYNLIDNALKYGGETMTTIRISSLETDAGLVIACEDDGTGIPGEDKQHLFEQGYGKHTGLGLFLTREILSITGITIAETSETGKGARFEILVPKASYRAVPGTSE